MAGSSTLHVLHQSLNQLKTSKLMQNELFRELYDEAKGHEKNVSLNQLVAGSKDKKLHQETNFYVILTKMLNELTKCDSNSEELKTNFEKIYKWYLKNRTPNKNDKKRIKSPNREVIPTMTEEKPSFVLTYTKEQETTPNMPTRTLSPVYFPSIARKDPLSATQLRTSTTVPNTSININKSIEKTDNDETKSNNKTTNRKNSTPSPQRTSQVFKPVAEEFDEKTKKEFLKALSSYTNHFYSNINEENTRRLKSNLKSLSKFYDTLTEKTISEPSGRVPITIHSLVEMAKDVSDKMVISRAKMKIRINENRMLLESFSGPSAKEATEVPPQTQRTDDGKNSMTNNSATNNFFELTVVDRTNRRRPKSTSYLDWRGHTSRPSSSSTASQRRKIRSEMRFTQPPPSCATPLSANEILVPAKAEPVIVEDKLTENSQQTFTIVRQQIGDQIERAKSSSSHRRPIRHPKSAAPFRGIKTPSDQQKEVKFVSFVQKLEDTSREKESTSGKVEEESKIAIDVQKKDDETRPETALTQTTQLTTQRLKTIVEPSATSSGCVRDDNILCECCNYRSNSLVSFTKPPNNSRNDIFHLTEASQITESAYEGPSRLLTRIESRISENVPSSTPIEPKVDLREILLTNYDKNLATKIGIKDFLPTQLMSSAVRDNEANKSDEPVKELEFIPFEKIDQRYPREQGIPVFDPNHDRVARKLYRTNPSIPRPESKYGTRSNVYEQIIELKKKQKPTDSKALVVWQPEDVHLVRDLLELENRPINEALKIDPLRADLDGQNLSEIQSTAVVAHANEPKQEPKHINTKITALGRPVNSSPLKRWVQPTMKSVETEQHKADNISSDIEKEAYLESLITESKDLGSLEQLSEEIIRARGPQFQITGSSLLGDRSTQEAIMQQGRPIPTVQVIEDPTKRGEDFRRYDEAKKMVHIPSIFKGSNFRNYAKEFSSQERLNRENARLAVLKIQRNYRRHLRDKRFIESRPPLRPELIEWARKFKNEMRQRKEEKERLLMDEKTRLKMEYEKFKEYESRIGIHVNLYLLLQKKGPEYTNKVLNRAATVIQRWVRGWLLRKEMDKVKAVIESDGVTKWTQFTKRYRKTIARIQKMRGSQIYDFEFKPDEALEFYRREKKFTAYFDKLAFLNEIELSDIEKMFNYLDYYPSKEELQDAKTNVLKYYKRKANSTSIGKRPMFDLIYYIYPPPASRLKSTRKSTWTNPIVDGEDALRLKGSKLVEPTSFDRAWNLAIKSRASSHVHKNTPEF